MMGRRLNPARHGAAGAGILLLAALLAGCGQGSAEAPAPIRPVLFTRVQVTKERMFGPFAGTIQPRYQSSIGFQTSGRMIARDVDVGDLVKKGQRLAMLESVVSGFQLAQAKADLANAEAQRANASDTENRQRILLSEGNATQAQYDSAEAGKQTAEARVVQAQASLQKARDQVDHAQLRAEFDGVVTGWSIEVGQVVSMGQTAVTLARPDVREAVFDLPDALLGELGPETALGIAFQADDTIATTGHVREIAPQSDAATRTRRIRLSLDATPEAFRLGTTVKIRLLQSIPPEITLPESAVLMSGQTAAVWLIAPSGQSVERRPVDVLRRNPDSVTIAATIPAEQRIVTAGVHSLSEGQSIKLTEAPL